MVLKRTFPKEQTTRILSPDASYLPNTIFAVCETWLDTSVFDGQLIDPPQFTPFRQDRPSTGGGVLLAIQNNSRADAYIT